MTAPDPLALGAVVAYCGWDPTEKVAGVTRNLDGSGSTLLLLPSLHVTGVSQIVATDRYGNSTTFRDSESTDPFGLGVFGTGGFGVQDSPTLGPGTKITWSENGCLVWDDGWGVWPPGRGNIAVTYSGGYDPVPPDLAAVLASIAKRTAGPLAGAASTRMGTAGVTYGPKHATGDLLVVEQLVLDRYRIVRAK